MICHYCRAQNGADDHRCSRCGRRLSDEPVRFPVQMTAAAPELAPVQKPVPASPPPPGPRLASVEEAPSVPFRDPVQPSLFGPMVVSKQTGRPGVRTSQPVRRKAARGYQQRFEFDGATLPDSVGASDYSHAPVALATQRAAAAAIDVLIPVFGFAVFFSAARYAGGNIPVDASTLPLFGAAAALIFVFYRAVCCLGNMDTPGMQCAGLRLLDFDGRLPTRKARVCRVAGGLISIVSAGMGLIWALADEERLTWHDHMSRTFPSPRYVNDR